LSPRPEALARTEEWVRAAVRGEGAGAPTGDVVAALPSLGPEEQVAIYRHAWFSRLEECLREDFPGVAFAAGPEAFAGLVRDYLAACPPRSWNIARAGDRFAPFLAAREGLRHRAFLAELATLEWTVTEVFDRERGPALDLEALRALPPERVAAARFRKAATAEVLSFAHPVNAFFQAVRDGGRPDVPAPAASAVAIYRAGPPGEERVWRHDLTPPMHALLRALCAGRTLEEAVEACVEETGADPDEVAGSIGGWLGEWAAGGVLEEAEPTPSNPSPPPPPAPPA